MNEKWIDSGTPEEARGEAQLQAPYSQTTVQGTKCR